MPVNSPIKKLTFGHFDTRKNLPTASKRGESNFLTKFQKVFLADELAKLTPEKSAAAGREFAVDGFGRADLLFVAWKDSPEDQDFHALTLKSLKVTAIEAKLKDWRKGLMQAARYRYFANRSLLILPPETAQVASEYIATFRKLRVGLWQMNAKTGTLRKLYTPRAARAKNTKAREKALHLLSQKLKLS